MSTTPGQVTISGQTISGLALDISSITFDTVPNGLEWDDLNDLTMGTRIRFEGEAVMLKTPRAGAKGDGDNGVITGDTKGEMSFKFIRDGFRVTAVLSPAAIEEAWRQEHGAA